MDNDDSFVSFTEIKLDKIYRESGTIIKNINMIEQRSDSIFENQKRSNYINEKKDKERQLQENSK